MVNHRLAVFAYDFPHKKSQDVLTRLFLEGFEVDVVIAAPRVKLKTSGPAVRTKIRHIALVHPEEVADRVGAQYHVFPHNSREAIELLESLDLNIGIIAGARILKQPVIDAFKIGIINFHPGLIPEVRGLDAMLWSIRNGEAMGVTSHLIDRSVDAGSILCKQKIPLYPDDTPLDISERLYETQLELITPSIEAAIKGELTPVDPNTSCNSKMPLELVIETLKMLPDYLRRFVSESD